MDPSDRPRLFADLDAAITALRDFLDARDESVRPDTRETRSLEGLAERYQQASDAVSHHVETVLRRSSARPRT